MQGIFNMHGIWRITSIFDLKGTVVIIITVKIQAKKIKGAILLSEHYALRCVVYMVTTRQIFCIRAVE